MADTKITSLLTPQVTTNPATDVLPIVNIADTSMATSGSTRKITVNQLLGAGGTATLASATITGDLTVRTNKLAVTSSGVGFGTTTPAYPAHFRTTSPVIAIQDDTSAATGVGGTMNFLGFTSGTSGANIFAQIKGVKTAGSAGGEYQVFTSDSAGNSVQRYLIDSTGVSTWSVGGSTAMTLNSTGLGVGVVSPAFKLQVVGTSGSLVDFCGSGVAGLQTLVRLRTATANTNGLLIQGNVSNDEMYINNFYNAALSFGTNNIERLRIDSSGNVGIGVTPSAKLDVRGPNNGNQAIFTGTASRGLVISTRDDGLANDRTVILNSAYAAGSLGQFAFQTAGTDRVLIKNNGQLRFVPLASDPAGAEAGDVYYNSTSNKLKCYNGTTWNDLF